MCKDEDYSQELCAQADCLGMESLTEDEQAIVLYPNKAFDAEAENQKYTKPCPYNPNIDCVQLPENERGCDFCKECEHYKE